MMRFEMDFTAWYRARRSRGVGIEGAVWLNDSIDWRSIGRPTLLRCLCSRSLGTGARFPIAGPNVKTIDDVSSNVETMIGSASCQIF